ncbi:unnamed protein product, partial [Rangifer tarandus platyrhynchus]
HPKPRAPCVKAFYEPHVGSVELQILLASMAVILIFFKALNACSQLTKTNDHPKTRASEKEKEGGDQPSEKTVQMVAKPDMTQTLLSE